MPIFLDNPQREARMMSLGLLLTGIGLGIGDLCFASCAPVSEQYAVTAFNVALCAGAAMVLTGCRLALIAYTVPFISVVTGTMLWYGVIEGDASRGVFGLMLALYVGAVLMYQAQAEKALLCDLRSNFEKDELLVRKDELLAQLRIFKQGTYRRSRSFPDRVTD